MHAHSHSRNESWPKPDDSIDEVELNKIKYQAQVDEIAANRRNALDGEKRRAEADIALEKADWDAEYQLDAQYHSAVMDVAKAAIERARSGAELVQKSAAAIGTAYAALLALSFSVANNPLPPRGAIPGIFLGLSIVLSTAYVAFITKPDHVANAQYTSSNRMNQLERTRFFVRWTSATIVNRAYLLRSGVIALAAGVAFLPVAFIRMGNTQASLPPAITTQAAWPRPDETIKDMKLRQVLYQAQVSEIARIRTSAQSRVVGDEKLAWILAGLGLILIFLAPIVVKPLPQDGRINPGDRNRP